jgi:hypothetical protein
MAISSVLVMGTSGLQAGPCASRCRPKCAASSKALSKCGAKASSTLIQRPASFKPNYVSDPNSVKLGEALFKNSKLSSSGVSCATCHDGGKGYNSTFAKPYPHRVAMAFETYGLSTVHLDEAIQMCMMGPMAAKPLPWGSHELNNFVAYMGEQQKAFKKKSSIQSQ